MDNACRGFVFLELIATVAILLIVIAGLLFTFVNCIILNEINAETATAINDAQFVLEQVKGVPFASIESYTPPVFNNLFNENVPAPGVTQISSRVKEITVVVNWTDKKQRQRNVSLTTRIFGQ